jgi:hypothetical protein
VDVIMDEWQTTWLFVWCMMLSATCGTQVVLNLSVL